MGATPIIPGFHPDPSICRGGDDYYIVNSSFEYLPGVPIFHSSDLVNWKQIGNVLDREEQFSLPSSAGSGGIFAPTLRYHDGRFWMITSSMSRIRDGHLIVSAADPAGPWSSPVYTTGAVGIDPDLFWDEDGTCYLTWAAGWGDVPIMQAVLDPGSGNLLSEPRGLATGSGLAHPEGPHIFRRGEWYYLLLAEGGTERGHAVTVGRSRHVSGPYEWNPSNPILSHRSTANPVQNTGHADLVETANGWAMVYLGVRPVGPTPGFHLNGRETFLAGVSWIEDWPVVDEAAFEIPERADRIADDFSSDELDQRWIAPGRHPRTFVLPAPAGGVSIEAVKGQDYRSLLAIRVVDQSWEARAEVLTGSARLVVRLDDDHWICVEAQLGQIVARAYVGPFDQVIGVAETTGSERTALVVRSTVRPPGPLGIATMADDLELGYLRDAEFKAVASLDGRYLSTEVAGGFTGRVVGVEPQPHQDQPAVLYRFDYEGR